MAARKKNYELKKNRLITEFPFFFLLNHLKSVERKTFSFNIFMFSSTFPPILLPGAAAAIPRAPAIPLTVV